MKCLQKHYCSTVQQSTRWGEDVPYQKEEDFPEFYSFHTGHSHTVELMGTKISWIRLFYRLKVFIACRVNYISSKEL